MKFTAILLFVTILQVHADGYAQHITIKAHDVPLESVLKKIQRQSGYAFLYSKEDLKGNVNLQLQAVDIEKALQECFMGRALAYTISHEEKVVVIKRRPRPAPEPSPAARQRSVQGTVTDTAGAPLPGVSVQVKGTMLGTSTDADGRYSLEGASGESVLVFSFMGYLTAEEKVGGREQINVRLRADVAALEEVVVVGYGTQRKSSLTSAVSDIDGEELVRRPVANAPQALQGLAAGVTVEDRGGAPGKSNATIRIRGVTTLSNNDPLVIVDGIEQSLQDLDPANIESITVLKDAASTAIYGSRAANGVVLVTTKRAQSGDLRVNYEGYFAIQRSVYNPEHMGLEDFLRLENVASVNAGNAPKYTDQQVQDWVNADDRYRYPLPNVWFDYFLDPAPQHNHTLSIGGGSENLRTLLIVNYFDQQGIIPNSEGSKRDVRLNTDLKVSERISLSGDINYRLKEYMSPLNESLAFRYMLSGSNFAVPEYPDGTYGLGSENYSPLVTAVMDGTSNFTTNYGLVNLRAEIKLLEGMKFQTQYAARLQEFTQKDFANAYEIRDYYNKDNILKRVGPNRLVETRDLSKEFTLNNLLSYERSWDKHGLNALLGYSQVSFEGADLWAARNDFYNNDIQSISQGSLDSRDNSGMDYEWGLRSYFGRLTYDFADKYFFEANARYDGSSRFTGDRKYSFFPSFSGAWRLSQEPFWAPLAGVVNEFKLRGSWGKAGNQAVDLYTYFETLAAQNYNFGGSAAQGIIQQTLANEDLTWETTTQTDIGADAQFWNGKLGLTFDYYVKKTEGILLTLPIPATVGLGAPPQNAGVVENKGWELYLTYQNNAGDFRYAITGNISDVKNKVVSLEGTGPYIEGSQNEILTIRQEGLPIDAFIGYRTLGYFSSQEEIDNYPVFDPRTQPGDLKYADLNDDGAINTEDMEMIGSSIPRYTFGTNITLGYKNFDMSIFLQGVGKANGLPAGALREQGNWGGFTPDFQKDYWTPENTDAEFPRPESQSIRNSQMSDFWMLNTAYLKLKNLQIGYTLPSSLTGKFDIEKLRVYLSGTNLFTLSEATKWGLDPEFPSGRLAYYPQVSLYTLGVSLSF